MAISTVFGIFEGIIVLVSIILIVIGLGMLVADQNWVPGIITLLVGSALMTARVLYVRWSKK